MDANLRKEAASLRALGSEAAADYLLETCPRSGRRFGDALILVQHMTWKPADQMRLARHYLSGQPHASSRPLEAFASFMALKNFATVVREVCPEKPEGKDLFRYNLGWAVKKYETSKENAGIIAGLLESLAA